MPLSMAYRTRPATEVVANFFARCSRWVLTVRRLTPRAAAISLLVIPAAMRASTSRSRGVSGDRRAEDASGRSALVTSTLSGARASASNVKT